MGIVCETANSRRRYIKTDKNGTKYYETDHCCPRCGGTGQYYHYGHCFLCGGSGGHGIVKVYTPEYRIKLDEKNKAAAERKNAEIEAAYNGIWREHFIERNPREVNADGVSYFVIYDNRPGSLDIARLKALGVPDRITYGYHSSAPVEGFKCIPVEMSEFTGYADVRGETRIGGWGGRDWSIGSGNEQIAAINAMRKARAEEVAATERKPEWVGEVGDRMDLDLRLQDNFSFDGKFGPTTVYKFANDDGDIFTWFTSTGVDMEKGDRRHLKFTVKSHSERNGVKENLITRVKAA